MPHGRIKRLSEILPPYVRRVYLLLYEKPSALRLVYISSGIAALDGITARLTFHLKGPEAMPNIRSPLYIRNADAQGEHNRLMLELAEAGLRESQKSRQVA